MMPTYKTIRPVLISILLVFGFLAAVYIVRATEDPHDRTFFDAKIAGEKLEQQAYVSANNKYQQKARVYFVNGWVEAHEYVIPKGEPGYLVYSGYFDGQNYFEKVDGEGPETAARTFDWRMVPTQKDTTASSTPIVQDTATSSTPSQDATVSSTPVVESTATTPTPIVEGPTASSTPVTASPTPVEETATSTPTASSTPSL